MGAPSTCVLAYVEVTFEASIGTREISASELENIIAAAKVSSPATCSAAPVSCTMLIMTPEQDRQSKVVGHSHAWQGKQLATTYIP